MPNWSFDDWMVIVTVSYAFDIGGKIVVPSVKYIELQSICRRFILLMMFRFHEWHFGDSVDRKMQVSSI